MIRIGEYLCGILIVVLMLPVLLLGFIAASFEIGHYLGIRSK
jgi:hypothetical protein